MPFDGALNPETVDKENVRLFEIREDGSLRRVPVASVEMSEKKVAVTRNGETVRVDGTELTIRPDERLSVRTQYAAAISNDIEGRPSPDAEFRPVQKPPAVFFAASREPLVDENGEKTLEVLPDDATAQSLEKIRQDLAPLFSGLSERGWAREDVAMAFAWTTVRDPRSIFDPETGTVPIPNVLALDEDGTFPKAALDHVGEDSAQGDLDSYLDRLHHWPPSTPIRLPVDADLEPFTLGPKTVQ
ncbi:MAG: hypothetical protein ABEL76_15260, partial [Bradymonadaceae bacterium]